ncbi:hypothetical protein VTG60DRAFT_7052 [Thermothelomyces hinnuleus]
MSQTAPKTANASSATSHCPLAFTSPALPPVVVPPPAAAAAAAEEEEEEEEEDEAAAPSPRRGGSSHGRQTNASPPTSSAPLPPRMCTPEWSEKPSSRQATTAVAGTGREPSTSSCPKSVGGGWSGTSSRLCASGLRWRLVGRVVWIALAMIGE